MSADTPLISTTDPGGGPAAVCSALSWLNPEQTGPGLPGLLLCPHRPPRGRAVPTELAAPPIEGTPGDSASLALFGALLLQGSHQGWGGAGGAEEGDLPPHAHLLTTQAALPRRWRVPLPPPTPPRPPSPGFLSPPPPFPLPPAPPPLLTTVSRPRPLTQVQPGPQHPASLPAVQGASRPASADLPGGRVLSCGSQLMDKLQKQAAPPRSRGLPAAPSSCLLRCVPAPPWLPRSASACRSQPLLRGGTPWPPRHQGGGCVSPRSRAGSHQRGQDDSTSTPLSWPRSSLRVWDLTRDRVP